MSHVRMVGLIQQTACIQREVWPSSASHPLLRQPIECVDFLCTRIAQYDRRIIRREAEPKAAECSCSLQVLQTHNLVNFVIVQAHSHHGIPVSMLLEINRAAIARPIKPIQLATYQFRPLLCPQIEELDDVMIRVTGNDVAAVRRPGGNDEPFRTRQLR